ncbi:MAG: hypothetical protein M3R24_25220 [Chloroflexota bacterium]|nr:hypothetical protein [Chloroflexota bacterium]
MDTTNSQPTTTTVPETLYSCAGEPRTILASVACDLRMDAMSCSPTLRIQPDGTMQATFSPEVDPCEGDLDPWSTVHRVAHV